MLQVQTVYLTFQSHSYNTQSLFSRSSAIQVTDQGEIIYSLILLFDYKAIALDLGPSTNSAYSYLLRLWKRGRGLSLQPVPGWQFPRVQGQIS